MNLAGTSAHHCRRRNTGLWRAVAAASVLTLLLLAAPVGSAWAQQAPAAVGVDQGYGFATVSWDAVAGASRYQIERTPLDGDEPAGSAEVVGVWLPNRYTGGQLTFADSGFVLGERYRWRVRAVVDGNEGEWSEPVVGDTQRLQSPGAFVTGFERSGGAEWTTHEDELDVLRTIAAASDRVRLETIGETYEGRPLHLVTVGYPTPRDPDQIAESPSVLITCTIHGTEPAGREACLILLRQLAFSDEAWVRRILGRATILLTPTANPDGRALNHEVGAHLSAGRTNSAGQDPNRDHLLLRHPEAFALSKVVRDHRPELVIDAHEFQSATAGDLSLMWPRSLTVGEELWALAQDHMTHGRIFGAAAQTGWWPLQYPILPDDNWEAWNANVPGLKNALAQLQETRRRPGPTRPAEGPSNALVETAANQQRRVYTHVWSLREHLDYHHENLPAIEDAIAAAEADHTGNDGPIYLDGAYDVPVSPPSNERPTAVLDPPPCGYRLSAEQYALRESGEIAIGPRAGERWTSATVQDRLDAHGIEVEEVGAGIVQVLLGQPLRAVIPYLLDPQLVTARRSSTPNLGMVGDAVRLDDDRATVVVGDVDSAVPNRVDEVSCSINDLIADEQVWPSHGRFIQHVNRVVRDLLREGLMDRKEAAAVRRAAAHSDVGR